MSRIAVSLSLATIAFISSSLRAHELWTCDHFAGPRASDFPHPLKIVRAYEDVEKKNQVWTTEHYRKDMELLVKEKAAIVRSKVPQAEKDRALASLRGRMMSLNEIQIERTLAFENQKEALIAQLHRAQIEHRFLVNVHMYPGLHHKLAIHVDAVDFKGNAIHLKKE